MLAPALVKDAIVPRDPVLTTAPTTVLVSARASTPVGCGAVPKGHVLLHTALMHDWVLLLGAHEVDVGAPQACVAVTGFPSAWSFTAGKSPACGKKPKDG